MPPRGEFSMRVKILLAVGIVAGGLVALFFGDQIGAFEERILTMLFGPRP